MVENPNSTEMTVTIEGRFIDDGEVLDTQTTTIDIDARQSGAWGVPLDGGSPGGLAAQELKLARSIERVEASIVAWC